MPKNTNKKKTSKKKKRPLADTMAEVVTAGEKSRDEQDRPKKKAAKTTKKKARKKTTGKRVKTVKKKAKKKTRRAKRLPLPKGGKGDDARDSNGRFVPGHHKPGLGNPHAKATAQYRSILFEEISLEDMKEVARGLIEEAKAKKPWAVRELQDRLLGKSNQPVQVETVANTDPTKMTDPELAAALERVGQSVPGILARKVKRMAEEADAKAKAGK